MPGKIIAWIVIGGIVGWLVSLILGRDFKGGCVTYVIVGVVTMVVLGLLIKLMWALLIIGVLLVGVAWLIDFIRTR